MKMEITQPPLNTTMMGVIRGVADYFDLGLDTPAIYGMSGHAFLMNIHQAICPSGPYCWKYQPFMVLLENMGIEMTDLGFFSAESTPEERNDLERTIRYELEIGNPCSVLNLDNQLISGFDDSGFHCVQPWDCDFPPARLSFGSWKEMGKEIHACFFSFHKTGVLETSYAIQRSLLYAIDLSENPANHTTAPYFCGLEAYDTWISAVKNGYGKEHGNWWNGTVWGECRKMGALYFREIAEGYPACSLVSTGLGDFFSETAELLLKISDRQLDDSSKISFLKEARAIEEKTLPLLQELAETIET